MMKNKKGFTLFELMIAMSISVMIIAGLTKLYQSMLISYSMQDQLTERTQNVKFTMQTLTNILMESGAACFPMNSDTTYNDTIIDINNSICDDFTIKVNTSGKTYVFGSTIYKNTTSCTLSVDNFSNLCIRNFSGKTSQLEKISNNQKITIYNLDTLDTSCVHISNGTFNDSFVTNDFIFPFSNERFFRHNLNFCINDTSNVLAENIDSLSVEFFDIKGNKLTSSSNVWKKAWSVKIYIEGQTSIPENNYLDPIHNTHYHYLSLRTQVHLKNKG